MHVDMRLEAVATTRPCRWRSVLRRAARFRKNRSEAQVEQAFITKADNGCLCVVLNQSTIHPFTAHDQAVMAQMRAMVEPNKGKLQGVAAWPVFDGIIGHTGAPEGVSYRQDRVGGITGWWCEPAEHRSTRPSFTCMAASSTGIQPRPSAIRRTCRAQRRGQGLSGTNGLELQTQLTSFAFASPRIDHRTRRYTHDGSGHESRRGGLSAEALRDQDMLDAVSTAIDHDRRRRTAEDETAEIMARFATVSSK
jgi:hypothetical protein